MQAQKIMLLHCHSSFRGDVDEIIFSCDRFDRFTSIFADICTIIGPDYFCRTVRYDKRFRTTEIAKQKQAIKNINTLNQRIIIMKNSSKETMQKNRLRAT